MKKQTSGRYRVLSYQLERELARGGCLLPAQPQPTRPVLELLLARGQEERTSLLAGNLRQLGGGSRAVEEDRASPVAGVQEEALERTVIERISSPTGKGEKRVEFTSSKVFRQVPYHR